MEVGLAEMCLADHPTEALRDSGKRLTINCVNCVTDVPSALVPECPPGSFPGAKIKIGE